MEKQEEDKQGKPEDKQGKPEDKQENQPQGANPFANLDSETQGKIQELQQIEQSYQQLAQQKQAFQMEKNETDHVIKEVEEAEGEVSRIIGSQVVIKSTKEKVLEKMKHKNQLLESRLKQLSEQEKQFSERLESLREEVMKKIGAK